MRTRVWVTDGQTCRWCKHYRQYYYVEGVFYRPAHAGHCVYPRIKDREPTDSCKYFECVEKQKRRNKR